jgi:rhamnulokinase
VNRSFLAFDLGAESGRAMLGRLRGGVLDLSEVHRFANTPVREGNSIRWDVDRLWADICRGLELASTVPLESAAIDTWGVDYALLDASGALLQKPFHYRDARTNGAMDAVFRRVGRDRIYDVTGIQFLPFNTIYQLHAERGDVLARARTMLTMPDYFTYRLTGRAVSEYTNASTTQCLDARARTWAKQLVDDLGIPTTLFAPLVEAGSVIGPAMTGAGTPVVATASHDTASAVAAVPLDEETAFLSSGTWSLLGAELDAPILTSAARDSNFTNEGGVCGTTRFLKNIGGLWLLQACRRSWEAAGRRFQYEQLLEAATDETLAFRSLVDPDYPDFLNPDDMPASIDAYCERTGQPAPDSPGVYTRTILESLAFKYRVVLESLERLTGRSVREIRIIGGGSRNRLLNQFTADATGRTVVAGPVEATSLGNIAMQMLATGAVGSLPEARAVVDRSFPVVRFVPLAHDRWDAQRERFDTYLEAAE